MFFSLTKVGCWCTYSVVYTITIINPLAQWGGDGEGGAGGGCWAWGGGFGGGWGTGVGGGGGEGFDGMRMSFFFLSRVDWDASMSFFFFSWRGSRHVLGYTCLHPARITPSRFLSSRFLDFPLVPLVRSGSSWLVYLLADKRSF